MIERFMLINSAVWTCSVTNRPGLTLVEAFESEKVGFYVDIKWFTVLFKQAHKGFPDYGKRAILFIGYTYFVNASFTEVSSFLFKKQLKFVLFSLCMALIKLSVSDTFWMNGLGIMLRRRLFLPELLKWFLFLPRTASHCSKILTLNM